MTSANTHPVDELGRCIVCLAPNEIFHGTPRFIPIALERAEDGSGSPTLVGPAYPGNFFTASYVPVYYGMRAVRAERGEVQIDGKAIDFRRYMALWKQAQAMPLTPEQFAQNHARTLVAVSEGPLRLLQRRRTGYTACAYPDFEALQRRYGDRTAYSRDGTVRLELDLRKPDGARDARIAASLLWSLEHTEQTVSRVEIKPELNEPALKE